MKTLVKKSNIQRVRTMVQTNKELIKAFTGIGEDEYNLLFFELAMQWADSFSTDSITLTADNLFWGFWAIEFDKMNDEFIGMVKPCFFNGEPNFYLIIIGITQKAIINKPAQMKDYYTTMAKNNMLKCECRQHLMEASFHKTLKKV